MESFAQALLEDYAAELDETGGNYARSIVQAARRMDTLIQDLLAYSRLTHAEIRISRVSLDWVLDEAVKQLQAEIQAQDAQLTMARPFPQVMGHHRTLVQVVSNLLANAIKFVAPGVQPQVRVWTEESPEWVRLWIEDNGIGIAPENYERIYQVFERLHGIENYPGTGIGLSIVQKGIARMGGRLGVTSKVGQGSQFWIALPPVPETLSS
jgi:signal transduction histidine kinase